MTSLSSSLDSISISLGSGSTLSTTSFFGTTVFPTISSPSVSSETTTRPSTTIFLTSTAIGSLSPTPTATSFSTPSPKSRPVSRTIAALVIGGLFAGVVLGGCIVFLLHVIRRRLRRRRSAVRTQPEERLMHLERMRGQPVPPLREAAAIQSLPPSKNIRVLNWLARTRSAAPPSVSQLSLHTMSERSDERNRGVTAPPPGLEPPIPPADTSSHSHNVQDTQTPLLTRTSSSGGSAAPYTDSKSESRVNL